MNSPSKYKNRRTVIYGENFDSKREGLRWIVLKDMERQGDIRDLERQQSFKLTVNGKLICKYIPDFVYYERGKTRMVCEDSKGVQTPAFRIKWALAQALYPEITWKLS